MKECCRICKQVDFRPKICPQCGFPDMNASKYLCLDAIRLDLCSPTSTVLSLTLSLQTQHLSKVGLTHQVTLLTTCYTVKFSPGQTGNLASYLKTLTEMVTLNSPGQASTLRLPAYSFVHRYPLDLYNIVVLRQFFRFRN